jgi:ATP-dependent RNA helicase HelY
VVATAHRTDGLRVTLVTPNGDDLHAAGADFERPPVALAHVVLPPGYAPRRRDWRREVGRRVRAAKLPPRPPRTPATAAAPHPVEADPQLRNRLRAATQAERVRRELTQLEGRTGERRHTLAAEFDAVLDVLGELGYVDRPRWALLPPGEMLARTFHECDLLVAECVRRGLLDGLDAAALAGLVSVFVYEHRRPDDPPAPWFPDEAVAARWRSIAAVSEELRALERRHGLTEHRPPEPGFLGIAHGWVAGEGFATVLEEDLTGGDFVRTMKQLLDLLRQLGQVAPLGATRRVAREAHDRAFRDVIADSSLLSGA